MIFMFNECMLYCVNIHAVYFFHQATVMAEEVTEGAVTDMEGVVTDMEGAVTDMEGVVTAMAVVSIAIYSYFCCVPFSSFFFLGPLFFFVSLPFVI